MQVFLLNMQNWTTDHCGYTVSGGFIYRRQLMQVGFAGCFNAGLQISADSRLIMTWPSPLLIECV